jgi:hypothetical protein
VKTGKGIYREHHGEDGFSFRVRSNPDTGEEFTDITQPDGSTEHWHHSPDSNITTGDITHADGSKEHLEKTSKIRSLSDFLKALWDS